jgi:hypothetical protein
MSETRNPAADLLDEAKKIVTGARADSYGKVEDNFTRIAEFWSTFKGINFTAQDVAAMMALLKLARLANQPGHHDSVVDLAGYAACYARCPTPKPPRPNHNYTALGKNDDAE